MRTLDKNIKTRRRLINLIQLIINKHQEPVLVLSRKKYEEEIKDSNPSYITTDHYPLVGSNEYEKFNVVVIFGTPEPRRDDLHRKSILLGYDEDDLHYIMRETNIIQGIHRIRIALKRNKPTYIYLLTNLLLPFKNVNRMPIGKLESLLRGETEYVTEDKEDRIREDILTLLEEKDHTITEIIRKIKGQNTVVSEVIKRLVKDNMIKIYKVNTKTRGRKPIYCKIV